MKQLCGVVCGLILVFGWMTLAQDEIVIDILSEYVADDEPGVVVYVGYEDAVWQGAYGLADLDTGDSVMTDDLFRIGSVTKPMVATVVLQLAEDGMIDLDAPIADYLPETLAENIANTETATVRQMLQMTSGIYDYTESDAFADAVAANPMTMWTAEDTLTYVFDEAPYFVPGEDFYYSNSNYTLAQVMIETITGNTLADELESRIFAPADMASCYLETPDRFAEGIVRGYLLDFDDTYLDITEENDGVGLGDGGVVCAAADLAKFLPALVEGVYLGEDMLDAMLNTVDDGDGGSYGLGIGYDATDYGMILSHDGATSGFQSSMVYLPDDNLIVVVLTNNFDSEIVEDVILDLLDALS